MVIVNSSDIVINSFSYMIVIYYFIFSIFISFFLYLIKVYAYTARTYPLFILGVLVNLFFVFIYCNAGLYGDEFIKIIDFNEYPFLQYTSLFFSFYFMYLIPRNSYDLKWRK